MSNFVVSVVSFHKLPWSLSNAADARCQIDAPSAFESADTALVAEWAALFSAHEPFVVGTAQLEAETDSVAPCPEVHPLIPDPCPPFAPWPAKVFHLLAQPCPQNAPTPPPPPCPFQGGNGGGKGGDSGYCAVTTTSVVWLTSGALVTLMPTALLAVVGSESVGTRPLRSSTGSAAVLTRTTKMVLPHVTSISMSETDTVVRK